MVAEPEASMEVFMGVECQVNTVAEQGASMGFERPEALLVVGPQHIFPASVASVQAVVQGMALGEGRRRRGCGGGRG